MAPPATISFLALCLLLCDVTSGVGGAAAPCPYPKPCKCSGDTIDCEGLGLSKLPKPAVTTVTNYTTLKMGQNLISSIGDGELPSGLIHLDLSSNPISTMSRAALAGSEATLRTIQFSSAQFTSFPSALELLNNLEVFRLSDTNITSYPDDVIYELAKSVIELHLPNISLNAWPDWLNSFLFLKKLDLRDNSIGDFPGDYFVSSGAGLTDISFQNTGLKNLTALQNVKALRTLDVSRNQISDPLHLSYALMPFAETLESLNLGHNNLKQLPRLAYFKKLVSANFRRNNIDKDNELAFPASLLKLDLSSNLFSHIPDSVKSLAKLEILDMTDNALTRLDLHDFPANSRIEELSLSKNKISFIDELAFGNLVHLTKLILAEADFIRLPLALSALDKLELLDLSNIKHLLCTCDEKSVAIWMNSLPGLTVNGQCNHSDIRTFASRMLVNC